MSSILPSTFTLTFDRLDRATHRLSASQVLPLFRKEVFVFFEDPRNLFDITPDWLQFVMKDRTAKPRCSKARSSTIPSAGSASPCPGKAGSPATCHPDSSRTCSLSGLIALEPPAHVRRDGGRHAHAGHGDLPAALWTSRRRGPCNCGQKQLEGIFRYRAIRIDEWARGELQMKL